MRALFANEQLSTQEIDFDGPVDLWHFYLLRSVGKGAFGKVGCYIARGPHHPPAPSLLPPNELSGFEVHAQVSSRTRALILALSSSLLRPLASFPSNRQLGSSRPAQANETTLRSQIHQQSSDIKTKSSQQRACIPRFSCLLRIDKLTWGVYRLFKSGDYWKRLTLRLCVTCDSHSKMTRIFSWSST